MRRGQRPEVNAYHQEYYQRNKERWREQQLLRHFKLTFADYDEMLSRQGGVCAACGACPEGVRSLHVDHDHRCCPSRVTCGRCVRGLLCERCNLTAGKYEDRPDALRHLADYLEMPL